MRRWRYDLFGFERIIFLAKDEFLRKNKHTGL